MKLVTFSIPGATEGGQPRVGAVDGDTVVDLARARPSIPGEMCALLGAGAAALDVVRAVVADASAARTPLDDVELHSPILRPPKILAVGLNYKDHIAETGRDAPTIPMIFNKQSTSATGPRSPIHLPRASDKLDYEGELAFVIGRRCRHVPKDAAASVIAGYCIANDVSVRDWQMRVPTFTMGKSWDTHCPLGPWITTADEVGDPHSLALRTWVNGELRQDSNTKHLLFDCFDLVEHLSTAFTLEPGDVVATGTPSGVGAVQRNYLKAGDVVRIAIDTLGEIENPVIDEPADTVCY